MSLGPARPAMSSAALAMAVLCVVAGCATTEPGAGKRYGVAYEDWQGALRRGEGRQALGDYERQAIDLERHGKRLNAAQARRAEAQVASRLGMYQRAIQAGLLAVELAKGHSTDEGLKVEADAHLAVADAYLATGDPKSAGAHFEAGLEVARRLEFFASVLLGARLLRGLGRVAAADGDGVRAARHGEEAVRALDSVLSKAWGGSQTYKLDPAAQRYLYFVRQELGWDLQFLVFTYLRLGDLAKAERAGVRGLDLARQIRLEELEAGLLTALGSVALTQRNPTRALSYLEQALTISTRRDSVPNLTSIQFGIARSYEALGRRDEALVAVQKAIGLVETTRSELQDLGRRSSFVEGREGMYHLAVRLALTVGTPAQAFEYAERGRARAFLDLLGNQTLSKGKTRALLEDEMRLRAELAEARALARPQAGSGPSAQARRRLDAAEQAYLRFLEPVRQQSPEQASLMTVQPVPLAEVQALLPAGTTLLEYLVTNPETVVWVIDREQVEVIRLPVRRADLVGQVGALRAAIGDRAPLEDVEERSRRLYDLVVAPARSHIKGSRLLIVPHDTLHYLPFAALRSPEGRWLVEEYTVATLPSGSVLKYLTEKERAARRDALVVGNPDVGPGLALPFAEREARAVARHLPGATVLVGRDATKAKVKARSGESGFLHFATHAELNEQDPLASALRLAPEGPDDGRLEVRELFGMDLHARLVVLSACETGLGKLSRGDELVGLQRAFLYAGTAAIVTTLWKVEDQASYQVMQSFYARLAVEGPAAALRAAQREVMDTSPHPFFLAPFVLTGSGALDPDAHGAKGGSRE